MKKLISGFLWMITGVFLLSVFFIFIGIFSEEIGILAGNIPRGGIYKIESVDGDTIEVRRLKSNDNLRDTDSWEFEDETKKVSLSKLSEAGRLDSPIERAKPERYFFVWKHHLKDINLMALSETSDRGSVLKEWRLIHNW